MNTQEVLNIVLIVGFLIIVGAVVSVTFFLIKALKSITTLADSLDNTTQSIREKLQLKALAVIPPLLIGIISRIFKKGRG